MHFSNLNEGFVFKQKPSTSLQLETNRENFKFLVLPKF